MFTQRLTHSHVFAAAKLQYRQTENRPSGHHCVRAKHTAMCPASGTLIINTKEGTTDSCNNLPESQYNCEERKGRQKVVHTVLSIYIKL